MTTEGGGLRWMGEQAVITVPAEIDATNAGEVRQALLAAAGQDAAVLIIDMSGTTFCDSAGVQAIIDTYNQAAGQRTRIPLSSWYSWLVDRQRDVPQRIWAV
jgi:anti-sigma B factor antagonist